ncbi:hypothetical protein [Stenotrophomonas maltophilia]|uniref:hypothetical protein n=1 Tax=Stenotrophomonas maltophilia TaxID=40324 RepID=UPI00209765AA|nr:hypothetical protein [Stenotrophomonas maltophilia]MCO7458426.1 hypothetical protein [Stenotrophomonas maltophilia]MCO7466434.1 hypothetical protein [Stenotrophomonas maltophilia]MCO7482582.1 hypothetical protein [Stenotrophomonas maltophilia]MCO7491707.1 hypothetical protein [Stenotrophomonas maltophilia]
MNEIALQSKKILGEMLLVDCKTPGRLVEHYERCSESQRKDYVAALAIALCVSEQRRRRGVDPRYDLLDKAEDESVGRDLP